MKALHLELNSQGYYDLVRSKTGGLETTDSYNTDLLTTLFTDDRAPADRVLSVKDRRGWAGSVFGNIGSILWTYFQSRLRENVEIEAIKSDLTKAYSYLITEGRATSYDVEVSKDSDGVLININIVVAGVAKKFEARWQQI